MLKQFIPVLTVSCLVMPALAFAHGKAASPGDDQARKIEFPDAAPYKTMVVDLHTHSVFSDGHVWPSIRVGEALKDGLDALAITEHLEWQPHLADIPHPDRNRAYMQATEAATGTNLMVIAGSEITREAPAGHINAVFISDANKMLQVEAPTNPADVVAYYRQAAEWPAQSAVEAANAQGAFVFWNHPYWTTQKKDGIAEIPDFHRSNARKGLLHGIEIANGGSYSEEAFAIALKHKLAIIGVSDVHNLIDWDYKPHTGGHRPVTLVLATNRTPEAMKEALFARRTVVWFRNQLFGEQANLDPLLASSLTVGNARFTGDTLVLSVDFTNHSDATFLLSNKTRLTFMNHSDLVEIPAHDTTTLRIKPGKMLDRINLKFEVLNALNAPGKPAKVSYDVTVINQTAP